MSIGIIGFLLATLVCAGMMSSNRVASAAGRLFVSFFRGTPLLVQLLLIYYLLPRIGLDVPSWVAAIAGMSLCTAAYQAEIMRGGFSGVPAGLVEAAEMCGMSHFDTFRRIRLPIAFKLTLPALINEATMMLKSSSLVSVVGVIELTRMAQDLAASTYRPLELYAAAGLIYLVHQPDRCLARPGPGGADALGSGMSFDLDLVLSYGPQILRAIGSDPDALGHRLGAGADGGVPDRGRTPVRTETTGAGASGLRRPDPRHAVPGAGVPALLRRPVHRPVSSTISRPASSR